MATAAQEFLGAVGFDAGTTSTERMAARTASAFRAFLSAEPFDLVTFDNDSQFGGVVCVRNIEFVSLCEHHEMPFFGRARLAYVPDGRIIGLSKSARVATYFGRRRKVEARLTIQLRGGSRSSSCPSEWASCLTPRTRACRFVAPDPWGPRHGHPRSRGNHCATRLCGPSSSEPRACASESAGGRDAYRIATIASQRGALARWRVGLVPRRAGSAWRAASPAGGAV